MTGSRGSARDRIAIATRIFAPEPAAASLRLERAAASLARLARTVVLTTTFGHEPRTSIRHGAEVRRYPVIRDRSGYVRGYIQYLSFDIPLFFRLLAQPSGTVVLCEPPPTTGIVTRVACAIRRFPYVYFAADLWSEAVVEAGMPKVVHAAVRWMEQVAIRGATRVLAVSEEVAERLPALGAQNVLLVGNGIDTAIFRPNGRETQDAETAEKPYPLLVYAGTASEVHGAAIFVEAMRIIVNRHPRARMVFLGHGSEITKMREAAADLPVGSIEFLPREDAEHAAERLRRADIALASVRPGPYGFAFPTKAYAAIACGTPVVYSGSAPAGDMLRSNGLGQVAEYDALAIADAVDAQLADTSWDPEAAREWVERHGSLASVGNRVAEAMSGVMRATPSHTKVDG